MYSHFQAKEKNKINLPEDRYPGTTRETEYDERQFYLGKFDPFEKIVVRKRLKKSSYNIRFFLGEQKDGHQLVELLHG